MILVLRHSPTLMSLRRDFNYVLLSLHPLIQLRLKRRLKEKTQDASNKVYIKYFHVFGMGS